MRKFLVARYDSDLWRRLVSQRKKENAKLGETQGNTPQMRWGVEIAPKREWKIVIGRNRCRADFQAFPRRAGSRRHDDSESANCYHLLRLLPNLSYDGRSSKEILVLREFFRNTGGNLWTRLLLLSEWNVQCSIFSQREFLNDSTFTLGNFTFIFR